MDKILVKGGKPLIGSVRVSGAKNAALPVMAASLLTKDTLTISNLPNISDISTMANLLIDHGASFCLDYTDNFAQRNIASLTVPKITNYEANYEIVSTMRASVLVLGPLVTRYGKAKVSLPGGCAIGNRPINLHLQALEKMGAKITLAEGYIQAEVDGRLQGTDIHFEKVSVGGTENILMAATLAEGETTILNAAKEPEVVDLAKCLMKMGAKIEGIGTGTLKVQGVDELKGTKHQMVSDRIEAGTYMVGAIMTKGKIEISGIDLDIMDATIERLGVAGINIEKKKADTYVVSRGFDDIKSADVITLPHPGFPTDMQAQFMAMMSIADGTSIINETIFENRFMHVAELCRMGANIAIEGHKATVKGVKKLKAAQLVATDLRASVSLVLAALTADGESAISRVYHIDRGYERIEEKLSLLGADIKRVR